MPRPEKREAQWKHNKQEWMTMRGMRQEAWNHEGVCLAPPLLQLAAAVVAAYQQRRCNLIRALSHERALQLPRSLVLSALLSLSPSLSLSVFLRRTLPLLASNPKTMSTSSRRSNLDPR